MKIITHRTFFLKSIKRPLCKGWFSAKFFGWFLIFVFFASGNVLAQEPLKNDKRLQDHINFLEGSFVDHGFLQKNEGDFKLPQRPRFQQSRTVTSVDLNGALPGTDFNVTAQIGFVYETVAFDLSITTTTGDLTSALVTVSANASGIPNGAPDADELWVLYEPDGVTQIGSIAINSGALGPIIDRVYGSNNLRLSALGNGLWEITDAGGLPILEDNLEAYLFNLRYAHVGAPGAVTEGARYMIVSVTDPDNTLSGTTIINAQQFPSAVDDTNSILANAVAPASGDLEANDTDDTVGDVLTIAEVNGFASAVGSSFSSTYGSIVVQANGNYDYTVDTSNIAVAGLQNGQILTDIISYTIEDLNGNQDFGFLTITINGVDELPNATDNTNTVTVGTANSTSGSVIFDDDGFGVDSADRPLSQLIWENEFTDQPVFLDVSSPVDGQNRTVDGVTVSFTSADPDGIGVADQNLVVYQTATNGGHTGYLGYVIDANMNPSQSTSVTMDFDQPIVNLSFTLSDIDWSQNDSWQDQMTVTGSLGGTNVSFIPQVAGTVIQVGANTFYGTGSVPADDAHGNVNIYFDTPVDQVVVSYNYGPDATAADNGGQIAAISDLNWQSTGVPRVSAVDGNIANVGMQFATTYGFITVNGDGTYTYIVDTSNPAVANLLTGNTLTDVIPYTLIDSLDASGNTDIANLTITINGSATDSDGDGVIDSVDLDDDNDGILDTEEGLCTPLPTGTWSGTNPPAGSTAPFSFTSVADNVNVTATVTFTGNADNFGSNTVANFGATDFWTSNSGSLVGANAFLLDINWDGVPESGLTDIDVPTDDQGSGTFTIAFDQPVIDPVLHIDRIGGSATSGPTVISNSLLLELVTPATMVELSGTDDFEVLGSFIKRTEDQNITVDYIEALQPVSEGTAAGSIQIRGTFTSLTFNWSGVGVEGFGGDALEIIVEACASLDTDSDGIPNHLDLDSDNDGIYDVVEAGGTDANNDGRADDDDNNADNTATNGIPTSAGAGINPTDTGSDGSDDYLNLDSDGDGCSDANEAYNSGTADGGDTGVYGPDPATVDGNGLVTSGTPAPTYTTGAVSAVTDSGVSTACANVIDAVNDDFTATPVNGFSGGTAGDATANDTLNGLAITDTDIIITLDNNGGLTGASIDANGNVIVPAGTSAGSYTLTYTICENASPTNCDTATIMVAVSAAPIVANDDDFSASSINGLDGGSTTTVLGNDTLNGAAVNPADITLTPGTAPSPAAGSITMNADGTITVAAGTTAGTYTYDYTICEDLNPTNCDTATATVVVDPAPIVANDDDFSASAINGLDGGSTTTVLGNDTLNGVAVNPSDITLTPGTPPSPAAGSITMNADGTITVAAGTTAGTYTYDYTICEDLNPTNCDTATATIVVDPAPIVANDDDFSASSINGLDGGNTATVLGNDTLNGVAVNPADITLTPGTAPSPTAGSITMNADGTITVAPGTTAGTYTYDYTICEDLNPTNCDTATATIVVDAAPIDAVNDDFSASPVNGFDGGNAGDVTTNDTLNGAAVTDTDITITLDNNGGLTGATIDANGNVNVPAGTAAGTYTLTYTICENLNPANCDTATAIVEVGAAPIDAVNDDFSASPVNGFDGGNAGDVTTNDTLNGVAVTDTDITITLDNNGGLTGATIDANGNVNVPAGTPAGSYTLTYTICENLNPTNCDTATAIVVVGAAPIDAVDDDFSASSINGLDGGNTTTVLGNDTLNGVAVNPTDITLTPGTAPSPAAGSITMNADGTITVAAGTTAGTYTYDYTICENLNPTNCDTATATIVVDAAPIDAVDDDFSASSINGLDGGNTASVLGNDTLNGSILNPSDVTLTPGTAPSPAAGSITMNADGTVTVAPGTTAGTYTYDYTICENLNPTNCDTATATIVVDPAPIDAVDDDFSASSINGLDGGNTATVLSNDTLNGVVVNPADITLTPGTAPSPAAGSITMNADGTITVAPGTTAGTYTYDYTICENLNPTNCDTATATVVVDAAPIDAVDDDFSAGPVNGFDGGNAGDVTTNDTLNGVAVTDTDITITLDNNGGLTGAMIDANGNVSVPAGTPAGSYTLTYTICENLNPTNCDTATAVVAVGAAPIDAIDDDFSASSINGLDGGNTTTVLGNDTLNGVVVNPADITLTPGTAPSPAAGSITMNADGTITVAPGTTAGTYTYDYTICENLNPTNCDTATATVVVDAAPIDAVDDDFSAGPVNGFDGGNAGDVTTNDTLNGVAVTDTDITITLDNNGGLTGATIDANGNVNVPAGTPAGSYTLTYTICENLNPANCDTATAIVAVGAAPIDAIDDDFSASSINGFDGGNTATVLGNDTLNGVAVNPADITLTPGTAPSPAAGSITMNADGTITVAPGTTAGTYTYDYTICENLNPTNCDTATATIVVDAAPIDAVDDDFSASSINGFDGGDTATVLGNDTLNGLAVNPADITLTPGTEPSPTAGSITMNADGTITVASGTTAGTYTYDYTICENLNPTNCDTATATIVVDAAPIDAIDDDFTGAGINSTNGGVAGDVTANDTLNGVAVNDTDITITLDNDGGLTGVTIDANGNVNVPAGTPAASYTLTYTICENLNPANCDTATVIVEVLPDNDGDGIPDNIDLDDDNDGITDVEEQNGDPTLDTDGDGIIDSFDTDSDGDGVNDVVEAGHGELDTDQDGDLDGPYGSDGIPDSVQDDPNGGDVNYTPQDSDGDGIHDFQDVDDDGDGVNTEFENPNPDGDGDPGTGGTQDSDGDGTFDYLDVDDDGDGVNTEFENPNPDGDGDPTTGGTQDSDGDGTNDYLDVDDDGDGVNTEFENPNPDGDGDPGTGGTQDSDGDGTNDYLDVDDDGDGVNTEFENPNPDGDGDPGTGGTQDSDGDGTDDYLDVDDDGDGVNTEFENPNPDGDGDPGTGGTQDSDGDGTNDYLDIDDDGDGVNTEFENPNPDGDGDPGTGGTQDSDGDGTNDYLDIDDDGDGVNTEFENPNPDGDGDPGTGGTQDSDGDGTNDYLDVDDDGDGVNTEFENPNPDGDGDPGTGGTQDSDGDGTNDYLDVDDDGDGVNTAEENPNPDGDGDPNTGDTQDTDGDGTDDYLDIDDDGDGVNTEHENPNPDGDGDPGTGGTQDSDGDGTDDYLDADDDGDGVNTEHENPNPDGDGDPSTGDTQDSDGDGTNDYLDVDDDGDGVNTEDENPNPDGDGDPDTGDTQDTDGDGTDDYLDVDDDGDGVDTAEENPNPDGDGDPDTGDTQDTDGDGTDDYLDVDDDGDGVNTEDENPNPDGDGDPDTGDTQDTDGDGTDDYLDVDDDGDGVNTEDENPNPDGDGDPDTGDTQDTDGDGTDDYLDVDDDGDGVNTEDENPNPDGDGDPDTGDTQDSDGDGTDDYLDVDDDGDGVNTSEEGADPDGDGDPDTGDTQDTDGDGDPDYLDVDDDGDGVDTEFEGPNDDGDGDPDTGDTQDTDGDGDPDYLDVDDDGDGLDTEDENADPDGNGDPDDAIDTDGDGVPDYLDADDQDGDGIPDIIDIDDDNDGILDTEEGSDPNGDGFTDDAIDSDGDGIPDYHDIDADNDGIPDNVEGQGTDEYIPPSGDDTDGNGLDDAYEDTPGSGDGLTPENTDGTDDPDYLDNDSDNDGVDDTVEAFDTDNDGNPDTTPVGTDEDQDGLDDGFEGGDTDDGYDVNDELDNGSNDTENSDNVDEPDYRDIDDDNDGIDTVDELDPDGDGSGPDDTDGDGNPNYLDTDDDNDGVDTSEEIDPDADGSGPDDTDGDGDPDYLDVDDDGDGINTEDENPDPNGDGNPDDAQDSDGDGTPDYLEPNEADPDAEDDLEVYNVVTPNGDGDHDVLTVRNIEQFPDNQMRIYNRWGVLVYETRGYGQDNKYFRGESEGRVTIRQSEQLPVGTYYYVLEYNANGTTKSRAGYLYINR